MDNRKAKFCDLIGEVITDVSGLELWSDSVDIITQSRKKWSLYHYQDCCETVEIVDIDGDASDLIGGLVVYAEEVSDADTPEGLEHKECDVSSTWTFYKIQTTKGSVWIRWLGSSNGYYSEKVSVSVSTIYPQEI